MFDDKQWRYLRSRYNLTTREQQIARLICQGLKTVAIAEYLRIRPGTVKTHVRNLYRKIKVKSRISLLLRFMTEAGGPSVSRPDT